MKVKINSRGYLQIERAGVFKDQSCPFSQAPTNYPNDSGFMDNPCGDWCPLFGEPERDKDGAINYLSICETDFSFPDEITDERVQHDS